MNLRFLLAALLSATVLAFAGCGGGLANVALSRATDPNRVVAGTVNFRPDSPLPADTEVVVTLVDTASVAQARAAAKTDLPSGARAQVTLPPTQLGVQTVSGASEGSVTPPVAFRIEFQADDDVLGHGLNLEARVSYGGRVRYRLVNAHLVTISNLNTQHELWVTMVR